MFSFPRVSLVLHQQPISAAALRNRTRAAAPALAHHRVSPPPSPPGQAMGRSCGEHRRSCGGSVPGTKGPTTHASRSCRDGGGHRWGTPAGGPPALAHQPPSSVAAGGPEPPQSSTPGEADRARHGHTAAPHHHPTARHRGHQRLRSLPSAVPQHPSTGHPRLLPPCRCCWHTRAPTGTWEYRVQPLVTGA